MGKLASLLKAVSAPSVATSATLASEDAEASFIGKTAKTFHEGALALAKKMEESGANRDEIWKATGDMDAPTFKGSDGEWRQEISDDKAFIDPRDEDFLKKHEVSDISSLIKHNELYDAYPNLKFRHIDLSDDESLGSYAPAFDTFKLNKDLNNPKMLSTGMHEIQHAIQHREKFASGYNPVYAKKQLSQSEARREMHKKAADSWKKDYEISLEKHGYQNAKELSNVAWRLEEVDRLKGYLKSYYDGGKLTDKRRHILNSGGSVIDHNLESEIRNSIRWPKRHRPQHERDAAYNDYIYRVLQEAEKSIDPALAAIVRSENVKRPYLKYQRQMKNAEKKSQFAFEQLKENRNQLKKEENFLYQYPNTDFGAYHLYRDTAGEVEARTVQERLKMTPNERKAKPPWESTQWKETPAKKQIILDKQGNIQQPFNTQAQDFTQRRASKKDQWKALRDSVTDSINIEQRLKAANDKKHQAVLSEERTRQILIDRGDMYLPPMSDELKAYKFEQLRPRLDVAGRGAIKQTAQSLDSLISGMPNFIAPYGGFPPNVIYPQGRKQNLIEDFVSPYTDANPLDIRDPQREVKAQKLRDSGAWLAPL